jgi:hypothetical protein
MTTPLTPGFYRVTGADLGRSAHDGCVMVTHRQSGPYVWGLSLWGPDDTGAVWGYRTLGLTLQQFEAEHPDAVFVPDP